MGRNTAADGLLDMLAHSQENGWHQRKNRHPRKTPPKQNFRAIHKITKSVVNAIIIVMRGQQKLEILILKREKSGFTISN